MGAALWGGDTVADDTAAALPLREFGIFVEYGTLPEAGGVADQPHLLFTVLEHMRRGWVREKAYHAAQKRMAEEANR